MNIALYGPPGSGKGTQGTILSDRSGLPLVSVGDLLRHEVSVGSEIGRAAMPHLQSGDLVPDAITIRIVSEALDSPRAAAGAILDGFPRTVSQAEALDRLLGERKMRLDYFVSLDAPERELVRRLVLRARNQGRSDDNPATIERRLAEHARGKGQLLAYYRDRGALVEVSTLGSEQETAELIQAAVGL